MPSHHMAAQKPSLPKGTRDFSPTEMLRRTFIFDTIRKVFRKYGFLPLETPAMENLSTLTGKYGEEGDQLIFKILNSGDFLSTAKIRKSVLKDIAENATSLDLVVGEQYPLKLLIQNKEILNDISEKALKYDLTVPFARYVVMNQHNITFPFRRYQIQPVWRADRPQKGRYREFYQCDADVIGTDSLICEAELIMMYDEALSDLGLPSVTIKINNRKVLYGMAEVIGETERLTEITIAIDKLDKIGIEGVKQELINRGITQEKVEQLLPFIQLSGTTKEKLQALKEILSGSLTGQKGILEIEEVLKNLSVYSFKKAVLELDVALARGLNYYTGAILEVKANGVEMGSIGGGGRYDDLTGIFGLPGVSGVGISFGADRIYDVMNELNLFKDLSSTSTQLLVTNFDKEFETEAFKITTLLRQQGISAELYPSPVKLKKQMAYADALKIPFVLMVGSEEISRSQYTLKNMQSGEQQSVTLDQLSEQLKENV